MSEFNTHLFIPRLLNQDAVATEIGKLSAVLMNANIVAGYKNLAEKARKASQIFIIDPQTNHFVYDSYTGKSSFRKVPYAPSRPFEVSELLSQEEFRIKDLVEPSIKFQLDKGANIIIAPYFFSEDASGDKFRLNHTLISDSIRYLHDINTKKLLFAMINIGNSVLNNLKMLNHITDRYEDHQENVEGYFIMIDDLNDIRADEYSLKSLAWLMFRLSRSKDVFVFSIGAFGEVLCAIGAKGFSSGLGWLETFSEKTLKKPLKFSPRKKKASQTYIPELFDYINDEIVKLINYKCSCRACGGRLPTIAASKKLHFLYRRLSSIKKMTGLNRVERIGVMKARLEEALELANGLYEKHAIPLQTRHISNWIRVLDFAKRWKHTDQIKEVVDLDRLINESRSK